MSANCPYLYDTNGVRHPSEQVFIREVLEDGSSTTLAVRSDATHGERRSYITAYGVVVDGHVSLEELPETQVGFVVVDGLEIEVMIEKERSQGRRGRNSFDEGVFVRLRAQHGEAVARTMAARAISALPGLVGDEGAGESRLWAKDVLVAASRELEHGLLGVLREHPGALQLLVPLPRTNHEELRRRVKEMTHTHRNVERFITETQTKTGEINLSGSADPLLRSAYRTLCGDERELLEGVLSAEPLEARAALLQLGKRVPVPLLEAVLDSDHTTLVKVAAFYALVEASPELAGSRALGVLAAAKAEQPLTNDTSRLCEVAVRALPETMRARLAADSSAPWLWQKVAVSSLDSSTSSAVIDAVCESRSAHPLARIAAVGRCSDEDVLARVADGRDKRLRAAAVERLMELQGLEPPTLTARRLDAHLPDAKQVRLVAIDIDGTFAADNDQVPARNKNAVRAFSDAGGTVAFTTTRSAEYALPLAREALNGRDGYLVCDDGASIIDVASGVFLRGATPIGENAPRDAVRAGHAWTLTGSEAETVDGAALTARQHSGTRGVVVLEKAGRDGWNLRYGTDKGTTLEDVALLTGVGLHECCVFGDGKVDVAMFEKVRSAGGVVVAMANAQPGVDDHPAVSMQTLSNGEGGVGYVLEALSEGVWPTLEEAEPNKPAFKEEVYAQYAVTDVGALRESLEQAGLGQLVEYRRGSSLHGGAVACPGHVTFAHPNDFKGQEMPHLKAAEVTVVGYVDSELVTALVCAVDDGTGPTTTRPDGKTYHVTLRTQNGVPPVQSNAEITKGWTRLEQPLPIATRAVPARRRRR
jgi:hydroxymethylpyrimidine pyrophosphatase-like HAD family hydrolase